MGTMCPHDFKFQYGVIDVEFDREHVEDCAYALLLAIGEDPTREGLRDTPRRYAKWWEEFITYEPGCTETTFTTVSSDQMIVVSGLKVWSLCEHHLLPFWCDVSIGYIAKNKILGLSKFGRIAQKFAHRLQVQEQLVSQIAAEIITQTKSSDVAVIAKGQHLCMEIRGIKMPGVMTSSVMRGAFRKESDTRAEFLRLAETQSRY